MGLVIFSARYIPDLATISEPLRKLTRNGQGFIWGPEQQSSFKKLKSCLSSENTLGHFRSDATKTILVTDSSSAAIASVLVQQDKWGNSNIICYASRSLSDTEKTLFHHRKEALAVMWACERCKPYLYGIDVELVSGHKPLEAIYGPR